MIKIENQTSKIAENIVRTNYIKLRPFEPDEWNILFFANFHIWIRQKLPLIEQFYLENDAILAETAGISRNIGIQINYLVLTNLKDILNAIVF